MQNPWNPWNPWLLLKVPKQLRKIPEMESCLNFPVVSPLCRPVPEVTSSSLGPAFPDGALVAMNSKARNFLVFRREDVANAGPVILKTLKK
jgi:hypothetical protein